MSFENVARIDFTWFSYCQNTSCRPQGPHCWVPTPAPTALGSHGQGRGALAPRLEGRAAGGGTAPDTRRPSQRWTATPPGTQPPTGHASQGDSAGPSRPRTRANSTRMADPDSPPRGRAAGGGERLTSDAPRNGAGHAPGTHSRLTTRATRATGGAPNAPTSMQTAGGARGATLGAGPRGRQLSPPTHAPPHPQHVQQPWEIRTPSPALRHSDTTMGQPAAPRKTRPRSPTLDAAHELIRAL